MSEQERQKMPRRRSVQPENNAQRSRRPRAEAGRVSAYPADRSVERPVTRAQNTRLTAQQANATRPANDPSAQRSMRPEARFAEQSGVRPSRQQAARSENRQVAYPAGRRAEGSMARSGTKSEGRSETRPTRRTTNQARQTRQITSEGARPVRARREGDVGRVARPTRRPSARPDQVQREGRTRMNAASVAAAPKKKADQPTDELGIDTFAPEHRANISAWRTWTSRIFAGCMALGLVIGLLFFARPTVSAIEKRALTAFPEVTIEGVLDGSFFSSVSTWYADTYPLRDPLVALDQVLESLFGIQTDTMMIGGTAQSDDIPETGEAEDTSVADAETAANRQVDPPTSEAMSEEIQNSIMDGLYVKNGAAYSRYYFDQDSAETYAQAMNLAAERLSGTTKVYSILIPNNSGAMLSEQELSDFGGADQSKAISYFYSLYSDKVTSIETYNTLRSHNSEYLYFRTDHHWTTLGAYYVYRNLCEALGKEPHELSDWKSVTFTDFLGTFYSQLGLDAMAANPDEVTAYYPNGTNDMTYWDDDGNEVDYHVITDVTEWAESSKYSTFIAGDKSLSIIENPAVTDGSSCVFVKDSYGCAFAPFLVDHYQTLYIIDFRYYAGNIVDFCKEHNVNDLVFLNNITMATATSVGEAILSEVQ